MMQHARRLNPNWVVWVGLAIGIGGFVWGARENRPALEALWDDPSWTWLAVVAIAALAAAALQQLERYSLYGSLLIGGSVAMAAFGVGAFAAVALILVTAFAFGALLLDWAQPDSAAHTDFFGSTIVGLAACSLWLGVTAHWRINFVPGYLLLSAVLIVTGWRHVQKAWGELAAPAPPDVEQRAPFLLRAALWLAFGLHVAFAALPERYHDALAMHLVIARALALFGYWHFDAQHYVWAVQPMGGNWLFGWAYVLAGEYAAKLLNAVLLLLVCGIVIESNLIPRRHAFLAAAVVGSPGTELEFAL